MCIRDSYKGILSISDIQTVLKPVTDSFFGKEDGFKLEDVYNEVFSLEKEEVEMCIRDRLFKCSVSSWILAVRTAT